MSHNSWGHSCTDSQTLNEALKDASQLMRHALYSNHGFKPESCSACENIEKFLKAYDV